jgi:hypothetical protein
VEVQAELLLLPEVGRHPLVAIVLLAEGRQQEQAHLLFLMALMVMLAVTQPQRTHLLLSRTLFTAAPLAEVIPPAPF